MILDVNTTVVSVTLEIVDDFLAEGTEAFTVKLGLPSGPEASRVMIGLNQSTVFIEDDDSKLMLNS